MDHIDYITLKHNTREEVPEDTSFVVLSPEGLDRERVAIDRIRAERKTKEMKGNGS